MRKFKLIKEYPGSPKLGYITIPKSDDTYYVNSNWIQPENYPEFWEKVVEKDYEILSFIVDSNKSIIIKKSNGLFVAKDYAGPGYFSEEDILSGDPKRVGWNENRNNDKYGYSIHSVKRLLDGEIFTIGDLVGTPGSVYLLKEFKIIDSENTIAAHYYKDKIGGSGHYNHRLKNLKKAKQPLFTTEDGVDIFEGDIFWNVGTLYSLSEYQITNNKYNLIFLKDGSKQFSTKEKAEEYILMNEPCLSINEVINTTNLKKLVQQKLNNKN